MAGLLGAMTMTCAPALALAQAQPATLPQPSSAPAGGPVQVLAPIALAARPAGPEADAARLDASMPLALLEVHSNVQTSVRVAAGGARLEDVPPACASTPCRVWVPPGRYYVAGDFGGQLAGGRVTVDLPAVRVRLRTPGTPWPGIITLLAGAAVALVSPVLVVDGSSRCAPSIAGGSCDATEVTLGYVAAGIGLAAIVTGAVLVGVMGRGAIESRQHLAWFSLAPAAGPGAFGATGSVRF